MKDSFTLYDAVEETIDGNAAYIFDRTTFENNFKDITHAFRREYRNFKIAYSFKTNYLSAICKGILDLGGMAEVVSPYELKYARVIGFGNSDIVYNGVVPDPLGKFRVAMRGAKVNVDNIAEYEAISSIAALNGEIVTLGVRVNIDIGNDLVSRFGVNADGDELSRLMDSIDNDPHVKFGGFHVHIGFGKPVRFWKEKARKMIELAKRYSPSYIDLGGGMFGLMPEYFAKQFAEYPGDFVQYAKATAGQMKEAFPDESIQLIIEPGTAMVGNTFSVAAHVTAIKELRGKQFIVMDCNSNQLGFASDTKKLLTEIVHRDGSDKVHVENGIIAGNTCIDKDYILNGYEGDVGVGDIIIFHNVGAYSLSPSRQFIVPRLGVYDSETGKCILRPSGFSEMFRGFLDEGFFAEDK